MFYSFAMTYFSASQLNQVPDLHIEECFRLRTGIYMIAVSSESLTTVNNWLNHNDGVLINPTEPHYMKQAKTRTHMLCITTPQEFAAYVAATNVTGATLSKEQGNNCSVSCTDEQYAALSEQLARQA